jgi:hypothetical protein
MRRLQSKVRDFIKIEQELKTKIKEIEQRDEKLINELETALCFGKIMFMLKPQIQTIQTKIEKQLLQEREDLLKQELI